MKTFFKSAYQFSLWLGLFVLLTLYVLESQTPDNFVFLCDHEGRKSSVLGM